MLHSRKEGTRVSQNASSNDVRHFTNVELGDTFDGVEEGRNIDDPTFEADYANDIHEYLRSRESSTSVSPAYMKNQIHINEQMRHILVDFIIEVHCRFGLVPGTLYLAINNLSSEGEARRVTQTNL